MKKEIKVRLARESDLPLILEFIKGLAEYEHLEHLVTADIEILRKSLFVKRVAEVVIAECDNEPAGFGVYFFNFSTFLGKPGIFLEDIFVKPHLRGTGVGKEIIKYVAGVAVKNRCGRMEWNCLDWNEPSIKFYKNLGAVTLDDWTTFRVTDEALIDLAK